MANGSVTPPKPSVAYYDFYKENTMGTRSAFEVMPGGPSLTRQEFAEECDINSLMKRYEGHVVGGPGNLPPQVPVYFDFADIPQTLMEYMDFMKQAEAGFMSLPAVVRKEFDNDAVQFVEYASDPGNLDQMRQWGLAPPAKAPDKPAESPQSPPAGAGATAPAAAPAASTHGST